MKNNLTKLDFPVCYRYSKSLVAGDLFFWYNNSILSNLGMIVPKKYGKAHERNLFKRRCRAVFTNTIFTNSSFCIIVKPKKTALSYYDIVNSFQVFKNLIYA